MSYFILAFPHRARGPEEDGEANHAKQHLRQNGNHDCRASTLAGILVPARLQAAGPQNSCGHNFARTMEALADMGDFDPFSTVEYVGMRRLLRLRGLFQRPFRCG